MTISKERFNTLAINLSHSMDGFDWDRSDIAIITESGVLRFANALLKAVETESEVVGRYDPTEDLSDDAFAWPCNAESQHRVKLIALPLVSEE